jgi:hypothetical protein
MYVVAMGCNVCLHRLISRAAYMQPALAPGLIFRLPPPLGVMIAGMKLQHRRTWSSALAAGLRAAQGAMLRSAPAAAAASAPPGGPRRGAASSGALDPQTAGSGAGDAPGEMLEIPGGR